MISGGRHLGWVPFNLVKGLSFDQEGPDSAGHLISQCGNHYIEMAPLQQALDPVAVRATANNGSRPADQQCSQVGVSPLGNAQLLSFAARAHLSWRQA